jgi:hypothetical protein
MTTFDLPAAQAATAHAKSGKAFLAALKRSGLANIDKSEAWGVTLMGRALKTPHLPHGHVRSGLIRPIVEVARLLLQARDSGYVRSVEKLIVDPNSGELRDK